VVAEVIMVLIQELQELLAAVAVGLLLVQEAMVV
jgi:hypothetical protein